MPFQHTIMETQKYENITWITFCTKPPLSSPHRNCLHLKVHVFLKGVLCKVIHASVHAWSQLCRLIKKQTWLFSRNSMCRLSCLTSAMQPTSSGRAYPPSGHVERAFFEQQWISGNLNIHHFLFETSQTMNSNHCVHWTDWWQNSNRSMILFKYMFCNCLRTKKVTNDISRMADTCECFILVLPDISATFDTTDHQILG